MATVPLEQDDAEIDEHIKPAFLRRVRISGYKSIAFCDVELQPFTIFVGRNGSGKSNFLDALVFLRNALARGVPEAVKNHGGREFIRCRSANTEMISIELTITLHGVSTGSAAHVEYAAHVELPEKSGPSVRQENYRIHKPTEGVSSGFDVCQGRVKWIGPNPHPLSATVKVFPTDQLLLSVFNSDEFSESNRDLRTIAVYNFNPVVIRKLQKPSPGYFMDRDGSNLASVIQTLKDADPEQLQRAREYLSYINEDVESFDPVGYGDFETVQFRMKAGPGKEALTFNAESMSDGTLRALAAIMAGFQIAPQIGHPSIVGIEEPETSLHPVATHFLLGALRAASEHTQVLLTTQSAEFLEDRDLQLSEVLVVRNQDGQTQIAPVDSGSREIVRAELYRLAELQRSGTLEPAWEDLDRQAAIKPSGGQ